MTTNRIQIAAERGNYYGQANGHTITITCERHGYRTRVWAAGAYLGSFVGKGRNVTAGFLSTATEYRREGLTRKGAVEYLLDQAITRGHIVPATAHTVDAYGTRHEYKHFAVNVPA